MEPHVIPADEMIPHPLSTRDGFGLLFRWRGRLMREVKLTNQTQFAALWQSRLLQGLADKRWMPQTQLTHYQTESGSAVLEHEEVPFISYPTEWSFSMVKQAAYHTLRVSEYAASFGYELKDAHGYNVIFDGCKPMFVDIGSFAPRVAALPGWSAEGEFRAAFLNPLKLWAIAGPYVARRMLIGGPTSMPESEAQPLTSSWTRCFPRGVADSLLRARSKYVMSQSVSDAILTEKLGTVLGSGLRALRSRRWYPYRKSRESQLRSQLDRVQARTTSTMWGDYHNGLRGGAVTSRVSKVVEKVRDLHPKTVMDIGANQGEFSRRFLALPGVERVLALDADPLAVDLLFQISSQGNEAITPVLSDAMNPLSPICGVKQEGRWRADVVVALAISHHLLLTQEFKIDVMLKRFASFSRRHLLVEFMPLGLWNGQHAPPVPSWYTREWFRAAFCRVCAEVDETILEENRILFSGRLA
ncbi:MAG TPA: hypothetical protein PLN52_02520 [Opitutaceae bacterium]|nr:hypothetical protein [Opitutaceae bacterium]